MFCRCRCRFNKQSLIKGFSAQPLEYTMHRIFEGSCKEPYFTALMVTSLGSTAQRYAEFHSLFKSPIYQQVVDEATLGISPENWRVTNYTSIDFIAFPRPYETLRSLVRFTRKP